jgi:hypothetical protein
MRPKVKPQARIVGGRHAADSLIAGMARSYKTVFSASTK